MSQAAGHVRPPAPPATKALTSSWSGPLHLTRLVENVADHGLQARLEPAGEISHRLALLVVGLALELVLLGMHLARGGRIVLEPS
ncbi:hypothetical protein ABIB73_007532 [Bradyrhizobium sp. F1.4.3]|uniref:hypothetical protein n=1 Tax=Bradyrhizobium sp. F1.4.3 TaxID=3156356 RepID=UPI0033920930